MPFSRPTLEQINDRIKNDFQSRLTSGAAVLRRSVIAAWSRVMAGVAHVLFGYLDWISRQALPDTAESEELERWATIWGVNRKAATYAAGDVEFTGTDDSIIPTGTELQRSDGKLYLTDEEVTIASGTATVSVTAEEAGSESNSDEDETLSMVSPIAGVNGDATVQAGGIADGEDEESDDDLRDRLLQRIQNPPQGGAESDYERWALEVAGITRAWVYPLNTGPGTVGVAIVSDDDSPIFPDASKISEVQDYIDDRRPVTADVTVFAPTAYTVNFNIGGLNPSTAAVKAAIQAELEDLFLREGEPGGTIYLSHIREAISIAAGEVDHSLVAPVADATAPAGQLHVVGTFTWS